MALVTYAPLVTEIKGSIAGVTFQKNTGGNIIRARTRPRRPLTTTQRTAHTKLLIWLPQWRALDLSTQTDWNNFALAHPHTDMWGRLRHLTGFNYFARLNSQLARIYVAPLTSPPAYALPDPCTGVTITLTTLHLNLDYAPDPAPAGLSIVMYLTRPLWRTGTPFRQYFRLLFITPSSGPGSWNLEQPWSAKFTLPWPPPNTDGMVIQAAVYFMDSATGLTSATQFGYAQLPPAP
jgi:hypothetical protein